MQPVIVDGEMADREAAAAMVARQRERFEAGWMIRKLNAWLFPTDRLGNCGTALGSEVRAGRNPAGRAGVTSVATCGSVSGCARCAAVIRAQRADEIEHLCRSHLDTGTGSLILVTFTLPHVPTDELAVLLGAMQASWEGITSGRGWVQLKSRCDVFGQVRADEVTYGIRNGWHPHIHALFFLDRNSASTSWPSSGTC